VNRTLLVAFLRQRFTSPMRVGLLLIVTVFPLGAAIFANNLAPLAGPASAIALILSAGAIGQDVSSGTLQLLLVRPVSRPSVLLHRWLASVIAAVGITIVLLLLATLALLAHKTQPNALDLVRMVLEAACSAAGSAAVMVMLSTLVGGIGDVGLFAAAVIVTQMFSGLAMLEHWDVLARACNEVQGVLSPQLSWAWMLQGTPLSWFAVTSWASTVTLALAVGIARFNRRELSYAAG
jgi:ABC-type transport system involved in multi-copper enzyme maturation permease subunit